MVETRTSNERASKLTPALRALAAVSVTRFLALLAFLLLVTAANSAAAQSGELRRMSESVHGGSVSSSGSSADDDDDDHHHSSRGRSRSHRRGHSHCDDDDDFGDMVFMLAGFLVTESLKSASESGQQGDREEFSRDAYFLGAPYLDGLGYLSIEPYVAPNAKPWSAHFQAEYAHDFDDLSRIGGRALLEHSNRFGLDTQWNFLSEDLGAAGHDQFWLGDANVVYRFAQRECLAMRTGFGVNWMADEVGGEAGFNWTLGFDYFPCRPWILSAEMDVGRLGDATLFHARTTAGVVYGHTEVFLGYDYYDIGDAQINSAIAGVGVWF